MRKKKPFMVMMLSAMVVSLEKRFVMRPRGLEWKKRNGARVTFSSMLLWRESLKKSRVYMSRKLSSIADTITATEKRPKPLR